MDWLWELTRSPEFWMGMSLVALAIPGPQTRFLPWLFRTVSKALSRYSPPPENPR
jgi:hypothetical protein